MVKSYFEVKVQYIKIDENGKEKKVTEPYLFDAMSFTEAETRAYEEFEKMIHSDFVITNISRSNLSEIHRNVNGDRFFKSKVTCVTVDEESGKEKKSNLYMLVEANTVEDAYVFLKEQLSDMIVPFEIPSVVESPVMDVFEYDLEEDTKEWMDMRVTDRGSYTGIEKFSQVNDQAKIPVDIEPCETRTFNNPSSPA